jgi:Family of unknown function (DUF6064)
MNNVLPFNRAAFLDVFAGYNAAIWPVQVVAIALGLAAVLMIFWRTKASDPIITGILAALWIWTGIAYHGVHFSAINNAAYVFAAMFAIQGGFFVASGFIQQRLRFGYGNDWPAWTGLAFIAYAMIIYPAFAAFTGHSYPQLPMFGVTPCPVTLFTFGALLLTTASVPRWLLIIPVLWSLIGGSAAFLLGIAPDWPLLASGLLVVPLLVRRDHIERQGSRV